MFGLNWAAVLCAGIIGGCLDLLWYFRVIGSQRLRAIPAIFVAELVLASALAYLISLTGSYSFLALMELILWLWVGFSAAATLHPVLWGGQSWAAYAANISYRLVSWIAMGTAVIYFTKLF